MTELRVLVLGGAARPGFDAALAQVSARGDWAGIVPVSDVSQADLALSLLPLGATDLIRRLTDDWEVPRGFEGVGSHLSGAMLDRMIAAGLQATMAPAEGPAARGIPVLVLEAPGLRRDDPAVRQRGAALVLGLQRRILARQRAAIEAAGQTVIAAPGAVLDAEGFLTLDAATYWALMLGRVLPVIRAQARR